MGIEESNRYVKVTVDVLGGGQEGARSDRTLDLEVRLQGYGNRLSIYGPRQSLHIRKLHG